MHEWNRRKIWIIIYFFIKKRFYSEDKILKFSFFLFFSQLDFFFVSHFLSFNQTEGNYQNSALNCSM